MESADVSRKGREKKEKMEKVRKFKGTQRKLPPIFNDYSHWKKRIWKRRMTDSETQEKFCQFLIGHHKAQIVDILKHPDETKYFSVIVNFIVLFEENTELGNGLLSQPEKYLKIFDSAGICAEKRILERAETSDSEMYRMKYKIFVRITALPTFGETPFPTNDDLGSFVKINGTLVKVGTPKLLEHQREYQCEKCSHVVHAKAKYDRYYIIMPPLKCENCKGSGLKLKKDSDALYYKDYQEVKIQEHFGKSKIGTVPHTIWVTLEDDLVDSCKPGDDVVVTGTVMRRWRALKSNSRYDIDLVLKANNVEVWNETKSAKPDDEVKEGFSNFWAGYKGKEMFGRNHILQSFCPQIYGLYLVKLAMVTVLAGGVQKTDENGCSARGMSHLLLVGDAGTGKSHLLRYASKISPRSVFTTGIGSTSAGLTVSAVRESGDWNLEAGALVLADGGLCCIDDFNSIREHDRTSIHEAMEQQSISVAKAGIVTKLHTRCSIFATTSPKGNYDCSVPVSVNVAVSSPLLSRFDIVLILLDSKNSDWDKLLCHFIFKGGKNSEVSQDVYSISNKIDFFLNDLWSVTTLQSYFSLIRQIDPIITPSAGIVLRTYYQTQRMAFSRNAARTTVRLLESLIRLSQGHARLMFRKQVTVLDSIVAISLTEASTHSPNGGSGTNALHTVFPKDPYEELKSQMQTILTKLGLNEILQKELQELEKNCTKNSDYKCFHETEGEEKFDDFEIGKCSLHEDVKLNKKIKRSIIEKMLDEKCGHAETDYIGKKNKSFITTNDDIPKKRFKVTSRAENFTSDMIHFKSEAQEQLSKIIRTPGNVSQVRNFEKEVPLKSSTAVERKLEGNIFDTEEEHWSDLEI